MIMIWIYLQWLLEVYRNRDTNVKWFNRFEIQDMVAIQLTDFWKEKNLGIEMRANIAKE